MAFKRSIAGAIQRLIHSRYLLSLRESFIALLPYFISAALGILLLNLVSNLSFIKDLLSLGIIISSAANTILMLFPIMVSISIGFHLSKNLGANGIVGAMLALLCFCVHSHFLQFIDEQFVLNPTGSSAYAVIIPSLTSWWFSIGVGLFNRFGGLFDSLSGFLKDKFLLILPFSAVFFSLFLVIPLFDWLGSYIALVLSPDYENASVAQLTFERMLVTHLLWFVGIHGDNMFSMLFDQSYLSQDILPGLSAKTFYDVFVLIGGTGCFAGLILAALTLKKGAHERNIAQLSIPFTAFNFCEIIVFALPIFFNPILFIPFLLVPTINFLLSYLFLSSGWIAYTDASISWMTPTLINGYMIGNDLNAMMLQVCLIAINAVIYWPFLQWGAKKADYHSAVEALSSKLKLAEQFAEHSESRFISRQQQTHESTIELQTVLAELSAGELQLHYQPQIDLQTNEVIGFEALLRLKTPQGLIKGPYFLSTLLTHQQTELIDLWVMQQAAKDLATWQANGANPVISINLNPDVLTKLNLVHQLCELFSPFKGQVKVEIIESSYLEDQALVAHHIELLNEHGIITVIDDFGTGYSSLFMLANLPVKQVKLDRQFLMQIETKEGELLYQHVTQLLLQLGYQIVAEGIETPHELAWVKQLGIPIGQGWYFEKALPFEQVQGYKVNQ